MADTTKKYTFTAEELGALTIHDQNKTFARAAYEAADFTIKTYIRIEVAKRLGIDLDTHAITFDIAKNTIETRPNDKQPADEQPAPEPAKG